jgi:hypothetical protein
MAALTAQMRNANAAKISQALRDRCDTLAMPRMLPRIQIAAVAAFPPPLPAGQRGLNGTPTQQMFAVAPRCFLPPWRAKMPGANGQALAYIYSHDHEAEARR